MFEYNLPEEVTEVEVYSELIQSSYPNTVQGIILSSVAKKLIEESNLDLRYVNLEGECNLLRKDIFELFVVPKLH